MDELEVLRSDHVFARYVEELLAQADLSEDQAVEVVRRAHEQRVVGAPREASACAR